MQIRGFNVTRWAGVLIFLIGLIILGGTSIYPIYNPDVDEEAMIFSIRSGMNWLIIGGALILLDIIIERYTEYKEMKEKIPEEDLRP